MSLDSIINFISKTEYTTAELSVCNYFRGDIYEYYRFGSEYMNILKIKLTQDKLRFQPH